MIIVIDGPEKVGKSSTIREMVRQLTASGQNSVNVRHWGIVTPDDRVYADALIEDTNYSGISIWDRSWASEYVYATLLDRNRRLKDNPWLGEWLHSRAVMPQGVCVMLTAVNPNELIKRRDDTDLKVNPIEENRFFFEYAQRFRWTHLLTSGGLIPETVFRETARKVIKLLSMVTTTNTPLPPYYCGPANPQVIFVGESRGTKPTIPGGWLPFVSKFTNLMAREMGDFALECGWTNVKDVPPQFVRRAKVVISCGEKARSWVDYYVMTNEGGDLKHVSIPHPSWLYRYNTEKTAEKKELVTMYLRQLQESLSCASGAKEKYKWQHN